MLSRASDVGLTGVPDGSEPYEVRTNVPLNVRRLQERFPRLPARSGGVELYENGQKQLIFYAQTRKVSQTIDLDE